MSTSDNHASNGYWVHDDFGPRHYVAPWHGDPDARATSDRLSEAIAVMNGMTGTERLHLVVEDGQFHLKGQVADAVTLSALLKGLAIIGPFDARAVRIVAASP